MQFKHPVGPGSDDSGWMKPNLEDVESEIDEPSDERVLSLEEIAKHDNNVSSCLPPSFFD